jgi:hypothetical protein
MEKITREYCQDKILLFYPKTEKESEFIQRSLFALGFCWCDGDTEPALLNRSIEEGLSLVDAELYSSPSEDNRRNGVICTSAQFNPPFLPKLTQEYCQNKILLFYPKTEEESAFIQHSLFAMGFGWGSEHSTNTDHLSDTVRTGMIIDKSGTFYFNPDLDSEKDGVICTSDQFDPPFTDGLPPPPAVKRSAVAAMDDGATQKALLAKLKALKPRITIVRGNQNDIPSLAKPAATALVPPPLPLIEEKADSVVPDPELLQALFNEVAALKKENAVLKTENTRLHAFVEKIRREVLKL